MTPIFRNEKGQFAIGFKRPEEWGSKIVKKGSDNYLWKGGKRIKVKCEYCDKEFLTWSDKHNRSKYCSRQCGEEFNQELQEKIRNLFANKCIECGVSEEQLGYKLHCHHIDYNKRNNNLSNLVPLCRQCHSQTLFGRKDWTNYFKEKIGDHIF